MTLSSLRERIRILRWNHSEVIMCDLDDTLAASGSILYARFFILHVLLRRSYEIAIKEAAQGFSLHGNILAALKSTKCREIIILSRNHDAIVQAIIPRAQELLDAYGFDVLGGIGSPRNDRRLTTQDKLTLIPERAWLIADRFEESTLKAYPRFISVDAPTSWANRLSLKSLKLLYAFTFLYYTLCSRSKTH